jgi:hypothetical protein
MKTEYLGLFPSDKRLKVALVKQVIYHDLYNCKYNASELEMMRSSNMRTGPLGLIAAFDTHSYLINVEADRECQIWREKYQHSTHWTEEDILSIAEKEFYKYDNLYVKQKSLSVDADSIDWSQYDFVISYDYAIPARIALKHPKVVWCLCVTEGFMPSFKSALISLLPGYTLNLNHHFRLSSKLGEPLHGVVQGSDSIDCPYFLQYFGVMHDILKKPRFSSREGIVIDPKTFKLLNEKQLNQLSKFAPIRRVSGSVWDVIDNLINSKFYVRLGDAAVLGNSSIEAVSSGCLFISSPIGIKNNSLFLPQTTLKRVKFDDEQFDELLDKLTELSKDKDLFTDLLSQQRILLDSLCWERPIKSIIELIDK